MTGAQTRGVLALQAVGVVLYGMSQTRPLLTADQLQTIAPLDALFTAGNLGLTILLATLGFGVTDRLLCALGRSRAQVILEGLRVLVPWAVVFLVAATAVFVLDELNGAPDHESTARTLLRALSFRMNVWQRDHVGAARDELAGLWVFSVVAQLVVALVVAVLAIGRRTTILAGLALSGAVVSAAYRVHLLETEGWFVVSLSTPARADAFLLGVGAAALVTRIRMAPATSAGLAGSAGLVLAGAVLFTTFATLEETFRALIPVVGILVALTVVGLSHRPDPRGLFVALVDSEPAGRVGAAWAPMVVAAQVVTTVAVRDSAGHPAGALLLMAVGAAAVAGMVAQAALDRGGELVVARWPGVRAGEGEPSGSAQVGAEDRGAGSEPPADR